MVEVWGILNVTPDSFSDGGLHLDPTQALARAQTLLAEGAHVIDVGAASSRPRGAVYGEGAPELSVEDELARLRPILAELTHLAHAAGARVSIDTYQGEVAEFALSLGADIVNDVRMGADPRLLEAVSKHPSAELVLMHTRVHGPTGYGAIVAENTQYGDLMGDVWREWSGARDRAVAAGIDTQRIWFDPGLGFAKTPEQSMTLLANLASLTQRGARVLLGASRKGFLAHFSSLEAPNVARKVPAATARLGASLAAAMIGAQSGVHAVRVHDVYETAQALRVLDHRRAYVI